MNAWVIPTGRTSDRHCQTFFIVHERTPALGVDGAVDGIGLNLQTGVRHLHAVGQTKGGVVDRSRKRGGGASGPHGRQRLPQLGVADRGGADEDRSHRGRRQTRRVLQESGDFEVFERGRHGGDVVVDRYGGLVANVGGENHAGPACDADQRIGAVRLDGPTHYLHI